VADPGTGHHDHDPLLIASLLDDPAAGVERGIAQTLVDSCPACAALHRDLVALSVATRSQPTPSRPRDFRLTAADEVRLREEPVAAAARLTGVMTDPSTTSSHRSHDTTLVASLADHSLAPSERAAAEALVSTCGECAALHADLLALVAATRAMPTPPRPVDYALTPADAARLRGTVWRRWVAAIGSSRDGLTRPLAVGLTTLGLVGLLVTSAPSVLQGGLGSSAAGLGGEASQSINAAPGAATDTSGEPNPGAAIAPVAGGGALAASGAPGRAVASEAPAYGVTDAAPIPAASGGPEAEGLGKGAVDGPAESSPNADATGDLSNITSPSSVDMMLLVSVAFLLVGFGLFVLRWSARRLSRG